MFPILINISFEDSLNKISCFFLFFFVVVLFLFCFVFCFFFGFLILPTDFNKENDQKYPNRGLVKKEYLMIILG